MRCARLAAPFVTALCIFDMLRGGTAARRSYIMVSSRASSSPMPQPASRHSIKPFSIQPIIANIRHSAVSTSQYRFAIGDGVAPNAHSLFAAGRAACPHAAAARWDTAPYRVLWGGNPRFPNLCFSALKQIIPYFIPKIDLIFAMRSASERCRATRPLTPSPICGIDFWPVNIV